MKTMKSVALSTVVAASMLASFSAQAGSFSSNIGVTNNYIYRGVTQGSDDSAVQGGIDYDHGNGIYAGTWISSLGGGNQYEQDWYFGYNFSVGGGVDLDVGYIMYTYPVGNANADFDELYVNATYQNFGAGIALTLGSDDDTTAEFSDGDLYLYVSAEFELKKDVTLTVLYGDYDFDNAAGADYSHIQLALAKGDFTFAYESNDLSGAAGDARVTVSWGQSFDL
ncbi:MAG TPA: hypothetical protein ENJ01_00345 [Gammaproteobacteria bacterium]|nr:hypothetical protein [Gammaproteobacteria bacterium]